MKRLLLVVLLFLVQESYASESHKINSGDRVVLAVFGAGNLAMAGALVGGVVVTAGDVIGTGYVKNVSSVVIGLAGAGILASIAVSPLRDAYHGVKFKQS